MGWTHANIQIFVGKSWNLFSSVTRSVDTPGGENISRRCGTAVLVLRAFAMSLPLYFLLLLTAEASWVDTGRSTPKKTYDILCSLNCVFILQLLILYISIPPFSFHHNNNIHVGCPFICPWTFRLALKVNSRRYWRQSPIPRFSKCAFFEHAHSP